MLSLSDQIKASLKCSDIPLWLPELTDKLVKAGWEQLHRETGLTPDTYGTARVVSGNASARVVTVRDLPLIHSPSRLKTCMRIELPTVEIMRLYEGVGVHFYTAEELTNSTAIECLEEAIHVIGHVPSLWQTVNSLVRSLHVLRPTDDEHDISSSEPCLPFSIFISALQKRISNDALRVAETIVHEAMHLQLTLVEKIVRLVVCTQGRYFSPWREEYRSARGILHAVYVFKAIDCFLADLLLNHRLHREELSYARTRRTQITAQMREVESFRDCTDLTTHGFNLVSRLLG